MVEQGNELILSPNAKLTIPNGKTLTISRGAVLKIFKAPYETPDVFKYPISEYDFFIKGPFDIGYYTDSVFTYTVNLDSDQFLRRANLLICTDDYVDSNYMITWLAWYNNALIFKYLKIYASKRLYVDSVKMCWGIVEYNSDLSSNGTTFGNAFREGSYEYYAGNYYLFPDSAYMGGTPIYREDEEIPEGTKMFYKILLNSPKVA